MIDMASVYAERFKGNPNALRAAVMGQSPDPKLDPYTALNALRLVKESQMAQMAGQAQQPTSAPSILAQNLAPPAPPQGLAGMMPMGAPAGQMPQGMPQRAPQAPVMQASGGLAGMPTADEDYASGGIVAFAGPTKANNNSLVRDDNAAIQNVYDAVANDQRVAAYGSEKEPGWGGGVTEDGDEQDDFLALLDRMEGGGSPAGLAASNRLMTGVARRIASRDLRDLTPEEAKTAYATEYEKINKAAGPSPYTGMRADLTKEKEERAGNLNLAQGEALLEAAAAVLEGNNAIRGLAKGGAKLAQSYGAAQKADKAARRSAAELEFHINDAERKERMGNSRAATAAVESQRKSRADINKAELDRDIALGRVSIEMGKINKPPRGAGGAGGEKPLKMNEQYYADAINFLKQTEKPKEGETPAQFNARIRFQAGTIAMKQAKTSDIGDTKANIMREGQLLNEDINVQKAMKSFLNNPKFLSADAAGEGDTAFAAELERQRALFPKGRVNPPAANPLGAPASSSTGGGQRDYSNLWNQTPK
jgi:hypothetical protein